MRPRPGHRLSSAAAAASATTTAAVSCAWIFAEERKERTALVDLDLHFGTVALKLDSDPGNGLVRSAGTAVAHRQPVRRARDDQGQRNTLRILAAEAAVAETQIIDTGAIDVLLYELRRKFAWVVVDLPRFVTPIQRVVLGAASRVILLCERSLAGLRDTIRLQTLLREQAPQTRLLPDRQRRARRPRDGRQEPSSKRPSASRSTERCHYDAKAAGAAANAGQPLPLAAPRSAYAREINQLVAQLRRRSGGRNARSAGSRLPW